VPELTDYTQQSFDWFYHAVLGLLNTFYPVHYVTVTSRDPDFITPQIKAMLQRKNRLLWAGREDEAGALAQQIEKIIKRHNTTRLSHVEHKGGSKNMWETVRRLKVRRPKACFVDGVTADSLNAHYASISTDPEYIEPHLKHTVNELGVEYVSEWSTFNALDTLHATATGLDEIQAWFLRLGAPVFAKPLVQLLNLSMSTSIVPAQWKQASNCPVPKTACPREHCDF